MPKQVPGTAEDRLALAAQTIANDIASLMVVAHPDAPPSDPTVSTLLGMSLALGRIYESVTGQDARIAGPKKLLSWAMQLKSTERSLII